MKNLNGIIGGLSKSGLLSGLAGGVAGGMLTSKKGRKVGKGALKVGALAAVGGVAWKAYQSYSEKKASATDTRISRSVETSAGQISTSTYIPSNGKSAVLTYSPQSLSREQFEAIVDESKDDSAEQMLLLRAMITAADADGHIDANERDAIFEQVSNMQLSVEDKASLFDEIRRPLSVEELVAQVPNSETAVEVYAASLLAIDESQPASVDYLQGLSRALFLPSELVQQLHHQAAQAKAM